MTSNIIDMFHKERPQIIKLFVLFSFTIFVLLWGWNQLVNSNLYHSFNTIFDSFVAKIVIAIGNVFNNNIVFNANNNALIATDKVWKLIMPVEGYMFFFIGFIFLALVPLKQWLSSLSAIVFVFLFIAIRAAIISYIMLIYKSNVLLALFDPLLFVPMLVLVLYLVRNVRLLSHIYQYFEDRFSQILNVSLSMLLFLLIIVPPLPRVLFTYIHSDIMPGLVAFILYFSKLFLSLVGRTAEVSGKFIYLDINWINLEYPCLGLGVFTLISVLIFAVKAKFSYKLLYVMLFALVYSLLNSLRLSVLLLYINLTYTTKGLNELLLHDIATYFMYIVAFAGFWVFWSRVGRE